MTRVKSLCPEDGGGVILKDSSPIRLEIFQHRVTLIFVLICTDSNLYKGIHTSAIEKWPSQHKRIIILQ